LCDPFAIVDVAKNQQNKSSKQIQKIDSIFILSEIKIFNL